MATQSRVYQGATARMRIESGLSAVLGPAEVDAAMAMWDQRFAKLKNVPLIEFVNAVATLLGLPVRQRHELRLALYRALSPDDDTATPAPSAVSKPAGIAPQVAVTAYVCEQLMSAVRQHAPGANSALLETLRQGVSESELALVGCLSQRLVLRQHIEAWSESALVDLVHRLYVAVCEAIGPVPADRMLAAAIQAASMLPEAQSFSPRRLL
jgi:hypothetical protein